MRNLFLLIILSLFVVTARSQSYMKKGGVNASNEMTPNNVNFSGTVYAQSKANTAQYFTGDGYDPARKYHHYVLWNSGASQWEFTSQSGAGDVDGPTLRSVNDLAVFGDGKTLNYGSVTFITTWKYPTCGGWTNGFSMEGYCIPAIKLSIAGGPLAIYNNQIMFIKRDQASSSDPIVMYPVNGHPRYVGLSGSDSLQFIYKEGDWHFMVKPASSTAPWNARVAADWNTVATNSSDTELVPPNGWNIPGGGTMSIGGSAAPLPVSLTKFDAKAMHNKTVDVTWETTEEVNAAYFAVERSRDLKTFTEIARKESSLNSTNRKTYHVTDATPAFGTNYYRLRQVDVDGKFQVYRIVTAVVSDQDQPFGAFPNPASAKQFSLKVENADEAEVTLYDVLGIKHAASTEKESDNILIVRPQGKLPPGMYLANVKNLTGTYTHRIYIGN